MEEQRKNRLLERDVERFRNRQEYMKTIRQLKMKKLWVVSWMYARESFILGLGKVALLPPPLPLETLYAKGSRQFY